MTSKAEIRKLKDEADKMTQLHKQRHHCWTKRRKNAINCLQIEKQQELLDCERGIRHNFQKCMAKIPKPNNFHDYRDFETSRIGEQNKWN